MSTPQPRPEIRPDWYLIAIDETTDWLFDDSDMKWVDRIFGVYAVNRSEVTHACELTPSYWLQRIDAFVTYNDAFYQWRDQKIGDDYDPAADRWRDGFEDDIRAAFEPTGRYVHCRSIDSLVDEFTKLAAEKPFECRIDHIGDIDATEDYTEDEAIEYCRERFVTGSSKISQ